MNNKKASPSTCNKVPPQRPSPPRTHPSPQCKWSAKEVILNGGIIIIVIIIFFIKCSPPCKWSAKEVILNGRIIIIVIIIFLSNVLLNANGLQRRNDHEMIFFFIKVIIIIIVIDINKAIVQIVCKNDYHKMELSNSMKCPPLPKFSAKKWLPSNFERRYHHSH